jgi:hypothetical protein
MHSSKQRMLNFVWSAADGHDLDERMEVHRAQLKSRKLEAENETLLLKDSYVSDTDSPFINIH